MGLKSDRWIKQQVGMIEPFIDHQIGNGVISYGLSSYGYDMRVADEFKVMYALESMLEQYIDPKHFDSSLFINYQMDHVFIPAHSFALARSVEYFKIPENVTVLCLGKSTMARCGINVNITPMESGWAGHLTIEISNNTPYDVKIYANEGIAQALFFEGDEPCDVTYAMRKGKYQNQRGIVLPRILDETKD